LTQEVNEKTNIAPTQNNWSRVRKEYGHVAYRKKQGTKNKHKKENQQTAKKNVILHDHITYAYEKMVRDRYNQTPAGHNSRLKSTSRLSRTSRNRADLCREVKETTKQVTQEWVDGQQTKYRRFQQKLLLTGRGKVHYIITAYTSHAFC
jgi:hypothetical protein